MADRHAACNREIERLQDLVHGGMKQWQRAERAEAERDALRAAVRRVRELCDDAGEFDTRRDFVKHVRAALVEPPPAEPAEPCRCAARMYSHPVGESPCIYRRPADTSEGLWHPHGREGTPDEAAPPDAEWVGPHPADGSFIDLLDQPTYDIAETDRRGLKAITDDAAKQYEQIPESHRMLKSLAAGGSTPDPAEGDQITWPHCTHCGTPPRLCGADPDGFHRVPCVACENAPDQRTCGCKGKPFQVCDTCQNWAAARVDVAAGGSSTPATPLPADTSHTAPIWSRLEKPHYYWPDPSDTAGRCMCGLPLANELHLPSDFTPTPTGAEQLAAGRADEAFQDRLRTRIAEDGPMLDRMAAGSATPLPADTYDVQGHRLPQPAPEPHPYRVSSPLIDADVCSWGSEGKLRGLDWPCRRPQDHPVHNQPAPPAACACKGTMSTVNPDRHIRHQQGHCKSVPNPQRPADQGDDN